MVGQRKLIDKIENSNVPNPLLIMGKQGMGKHTLAKLIEDRLGVEKALDISKKLDPDFINELYISPEYIMVVIDFTELAQGKKLESTQNSILKLIEEPPANKQIVLLAQSGNQVLDTIRNRCQLWAMEDYSVAELREIGGDNLSNMSDEMIKNIIETPLDALTVNDTKLDEMVKLANTMVTMIGGANISNTLTISNNKVDYAGQDRDKFNFDILLNILLNTLNRYVKENPDIKYIAAYKLTHQLKVNIDVANVTKLYLFNKYLLELRDILR